MAAAGAAAYCVALFPHRTGARDIVMALMEAGSPGRLTIQYPPGETLFPPEISAPSFRWKDDDPCSDLWLVMIEFAGTGPIYAFAEQSPWRPRASVWETIKQQSLEKPATVTVVGINRKKRSQALSAGRVTIRTSSDRVAAPLFYREVNYMLLQPDSELYIIPAEGGEARKLRANTKRMNSWHSFSPNGRWLAFSGKPDSPYTQLFLTHIDEHGESTPAVVLDHLTAPDRAANIPEFVNADAAAIRRIQEKFVDDLSFIRAAWEYLRLGDYQGAELQCRKALELNPKSGRAHYLLGLAMFGRNRYDEALTSLEDALHIAQAPGDQGLIGKITKQITLCKQNKPPANPANKTGGG